ncbi:MAG: hypothetical protein SNJ58_07355, partial [Aggregatilineales bacterium]
MDIFRRLRYLIGLFFLAAACDLAPPPLPTLAVLPTLPEVAAEIVDTPTPPPPTPTRFTLPPTWTPLHSPSATPSQRTELANTQAFRIEANIAKVENRRRINFSLWLTLQTQLVQSATLRYTFPSSDTTEEKRVPLPPQKLGETLKSPIAHTMAIAQMPPHEDQIVYEWLVEAQDGNLR